MRILITNDDGYDYKGINALAETLRAMGDLTVVAPKYHQSGMSMAVSIGFKQIAVKQLRPKPEEWYYVDGTPASCVKFALDEIFKDEKPDLIVSGINHGSNVASAALYSGTLGACREGALAGVPSVGVSIDSISMNPDFTCVKELFPGLLKKILDNWGDRFGVYYNVNFPNLPTADIKGIKVGRQGILHWVDEFQPFTMKIFDRIGITPKDVGIVAFPELEPGERAVMMTGEMANDDRNDENCDNIILADENIAITVHNVDTTDYIEMERVKSIFQL